VRDRALPHGAAGLLRLLDHAAERGVGSPQYDPDALRNFFNPPPAYEEDEDDDDDARASVLAGFEYIMQHLAAHSDKSEELSDAADFMLHPRVATASLREVLRQRPAALEDGGGTRSSALACCAVDVCELILYAEHIAPREASPTMNALQAAAEEQLAVYWLLARAAAARHGSDAVARRLRPSGAGAGDDAAADVLPTHAARGACAAGRRRRAHAAGLLCCGHDGAPARAGG
jgi:hypothetical protein